MPFQKGDININRSGRSKSDSLQYDAEFLLRSILKDIKKDVSNLSSTMKIKLLTALLPYSLPKQQAIEFTSRSEIDNMSNEELTALLDKVFDKYNKDKE